MATQQGLYDSKAVAVSMLKRLTDAGGIKEGTPEYDTVVASTQSVIEDHLKEYNRKYIDTLTLYEKCVEDSASTKASYNNQISNLQKEVKTQKEKNKEDVRRATANFKQERDEVIKRADKERLELEVERGKLEERKKEARADADKYKKEAQEAVEERAKTIKLWEEEKDNSKQLQETITSLTKAQGDIEFEARGWKREADQTTDFKEEAESQLNKARKDLEPTKLKNQELTQKLGKLKAELKSAKGTVSKQEKEISKLKVELAVTTEQLHTYKAKSRGSTPKNDHTGSAAFELAGMGGSDTPRSGSAVSRSSDQVDYVSREIHDATIGEKTKEVADLKAERDRLQNDSVNCQTALKKLQDEVSKKDGAKIKELKAKIRDLEKQIMAAKDNDTNKSTKNTGLEDELKRVEEELQTTKQELKDMTDNFNDHLKLLSEAESARDKLQMQYQALEKTLKQRNEAQNGLTEELHKAEKARASLHRAVERMLEPNIDIADLQGFSEQVPNLVKLRQQAFDVQERLIPLVLKAAADYSTITGRGFVIHGHNTTAQGRPYISRADDFIDDIRELYNRFTKRLRDAQVDMDKSKESAKAENTAAQETIDSMQKQIDTLENESKDLERTLKTSQENTARYENDGTNQSRAIRDIRALARKFLTNAGPSLKDLDNLLVNLVKLQKTVPGAIPFGEETERKAQQFGETRKQLDECRDERTRLQDRYKASKKSLDDSNQERKRLQSEVARLAAELKALRDSHTQDDDQARRQLEEAFGRISGQLQTLRDEGDDERSRHAEEVADLASQLQTIRNRLEQARNDSAEEIQRREADIKALQDSSDEEITRLGNDVGRLTGELQNARDSCERERRRLEGEVKRLTNELRNLRKSSDQERAAHAEEVRRLNGDLETLRDNSEQENRRLEQNVTRLEQEVTRLEHEVARLNAELQALRNTLGEQNDVIGGNGQQANRTQETLSGQIATLTDAQMGLMRSMENMRQHAVAQGRSAAETQRSLARARDEIELFRDLKDQLVVERDLLQDLVQGCVEAEGNGRRSLRANPAAAAAADAGAGAGAGAGDAGARAGVVAGTSNFIGRTYDQFLATIRYGTVWGTLGSVFVMMVVVIIAEGRQYAEWQDANAHSRALWMTVRDRPTVCLGPPNIDYFWHTLAVALSGRWAFR